LLPFDPISRFIPDFADSEFKNVLSNSGIAPSHLLGGLCSFRVSAYPLRSLQLHAAVRGRDVDQWPASANGEVVIARPQVACHVQREIGL
jgi:hypothetical protein